MLLQYVLEGMVVYPNKMDFPVMENFGVSPPPLGMLEITIERAEGLINSDFLGKSDPYCEVRGAASPVCHLPVALCSYLRCTLAGRFTKSAGRCGVCTRALRCS